MHWFFIIQFNSCSPNPDQKVSLKVSLITCAIRYTWWLTPSSPCPLCMSRCLWSPAWCRPTPRTPQGLTAGPRWSWTMLLLRSAMVMMVIKISLVILEVLQRWPPPSRPGVHRRRSRGRSARCKRRGNDCRCKPTSHQCALVQLWRSVKFTNFRIRFVDCRSLFFQGNILRVVNTGR